MRSDLAGGRRSAGGAGGRRGAAGEGAADGAAELVQVEGLAQQLGVGQCGGGRLLERQGHMDVFGLQVVEALIDVRGGRKAVPGVEPYR